jgi:hypothetical protein
VEFPRGWSQNFPPIEAINKTLVIQIIHLVN